MGDKNNAGEYNGAWNETTKHERNNFGTVPESRGVPADKQKPDACFTGEPEGATETAGGSRYCVRYSLQSIVYFCKVLSTESKQK